MSERVKISHKQYKKGLKTQEDASKSENAIRTKTIPKVSLKHQNKK